MNRATNDGGDFRSLPVPFGEPSDLSVAPSTAEGYLQLVRALSRRVPDVMVMEGALECETAVSVVSAPSAAITPVPDSASATWAAATLESFSRLRATLLHVAVALEEGRYLLAPALARNAAPLSAVSATEWRQLIAGGTSVDEGGNGGGAGAAFAASQVWYADDADGDAEWEEGEGADEDGGFYDGGEVACTNEGGGGGSDEGVGEASAPDEHVDETDSSSRLPLAPSLPTVASLDQLTVLRLLGFLIRDVRSAWTRGGDSKQYISPAQVSWLYALLAALQLPLLNTTAAAIRDLFVLLRSQRDALTACSEANAKALARAGVETLLVICGDSFGQKGRR